MTDDEYSYRMPLDWHPDGHQILVVQGDPNITIRDFVQNDSEDIQHAFSLHISQSVTLPLIFTAKWDTTGERIATGWQETMHIIEAETGETLQTLSMEAFRFYGLSWHPEKNMLAFIGYQRSGGKSKGTPFDDRIFIWDISNDEIVEIPGIDITNIQVETSHNTVQWSPDGSRLAAVSVDDGKIIIWETENYEIIAEYDGYRSLIPEEGE